MALHTISNGTMAPPSSTRLTSQDLVAPLSSRLVFSVHDSVTDLRIPFGCRIGTNSNLGDEFVLALCDVTVNESNKTRDCSNLKLQEPQF